MVGILQDMNFIHRKRHALTLYGFHTCENPTSVNHSDPLPSTSTMNRNADQPSTQVSQNAGRQLTASSHGVQTSAFTNANDVRVKNGSINITTNVNTASKPLKVLYKRVAPHAISNEGGRADNPKCHPGTREEVIGLLEKWISAAESNRILWLSGPAGGGKTAIVKTFTEHATDHGVRTISFYFFRGDSTRNSAAPVVPTLLYQLFQLCPGSSEVVADVLSTHPRILDGSLVEQFNLVSKLIPIIRQTPTDDPVLLVVDGLDECDVEAELSQANVIRALAGLVTEEDSPFRVLVASRPEARIRMAFNRLSSPAQTIFLDEQYSPEKDIRVFVTAEFDEIKASHPSAHLVGGDWPPSSDVDQIVLKSSGQFIYAATVMRYISHPSTVPSLSLERVRGIVPVGKNSPFAHLDTIYTFILAQPDDPEATREVLSVALLPEIESEHITLLHRYNSRNSQALIQSCISQLSAIIELTAGENIRSYHASLEDFLADPDRSGVYSVDVDAFRGKLLISLWHESPRILIYVENTQLHLFYSLQRPNHDIADMLLNLPLPLWFTLDNVDFQDPTGIQSLLSRSVRELYNALSNDTSQQIIQRLEEHPRWLPGPMTITPPIKGHNGRPKKVLFSFSWWRKTLHITRSKKQDRM
ncbi:hypothetical protein D9619_010154 [Psilocybe cf. subviscida]|uniref:NACHT domain-containing protein n=1 Tax=Psilocybe cf. subviscida TaxID=2480587 RepID=A0A8H5AU95_9AGAR|nr:hypothetical protein D9619_010154 [Psilocybe cf. subviscida]